MRGSAKNLTRFPTKWNTFWNVRSKLACVVMIFHCCKWDSFDSTVRVRQAPPLFLKLQYVFSNQNQVNSWQIKTSFSFLDFVYSTIFAKVSLFRRFFSYLWTQDEPHGLNLKYLLPLNFCVVLSPISVLKFVFIWSTTLLTLFETIYV